MDETAEYVAERDKALSDMDMEWLREKMPLASHEVLLITAHKMRYECVNIRIEKRRESRAWLESNGYRRMSGLAWDD